DESRTAVHLAFRLAKRDVTSREITLKFVLLCGHGLQRFARRLTQGVHDQITIYAGAIRVETETCPLCCDCDLHRAYGISIAPMSHRRENRQLWILPSLRMIRHFWNVRWRQDVRSEVVQPTQTDSPRSPTRHCFVRCN